MLQEQEPDKSARLYRPSESDTLEYKVMEILDEISAYVDCLLDLSPCLDNPALEYPGGSKLQPKKSYTVSSEKALIYCRKIRDHFKVLPKYLWNGWRKQMSSGLPP